MANRTAGQPFGSSVLRHVLRAPARASEKMKRLHARFLLSIQKGGFPFFKIFFALLLAFSESHGLGDEPLKPSHQVARDSQLSNPPDGLTLDLAPCNLSYRVLRNLRNLFVGRSPYCQIPRQIPGNEFTDLSRTILPRTNFSEEKIPNAYFFKADLSRADFQDAELRFSFFQGARMPQVRLNRSNISNAIFSEALLRGAFITNAQLNHSRFVKANLISADLAHSSGENANFAFAKMAFARLYRSMLKNAFLFRSDLFGADLRLSNLSWSNFTRSNLDLASLEGGVFIEANFTDASMKSVNLRNTNLQGAILKNVKFSRHSRLVAPPSDFTKSNLSGADLRGSTVTKRQLADAILCGTKTNWGMLNRDCHTLLGN